MSMQILLEKIIIKQSKTIQSDARTVTPRSDTRIPTSTGIEMQR